jgi:chromosomal replication initiation ATPase DnaA
MILLPATEQVFDDVAKKYRTTREHLRGRSRLAKICTARHELIVRLYFERNLSTPQIGSLLNRNHTTILHYLHREEWLKRKRDRRQHGTAANTGL